MSDTIKPTMYEALLSVQKEAPALQKDAINPHFKSKYISLDTLMQAIVPILNKHGFVWLTMPCVDQLTHDPALGYALVYTPTGEKLEGTALLQARSSSPQDQGSAITYMRRYSLMAVLGLVADEDDDGNKATEAVQAPISEVSKQNIYSMLQKLGKDPSEYEKAIKKRIDDLTNVEAGAHINSLKSRVQRAAAEAGANA